MKNLVSLHILCLFFLIACANNSNQIPESLSSSYDGIWDGSAQSYIYEEEERVYIKLEIKNGIVSGSFLDQKVKGYMTSDNRLIINPFVIRSTGRFNLGPPVYIIIEPNLMSPDRIEGTYYRDQVQNEIATIYKWYVVKPATGKSNSTISNVE